MNIKAVEIMRVCNETYAQPFKPHLSFWHHFAHWFSIIGVIVLLFLYACEERNFTRMERDIKKIDNRVSTFEDSLFLESGRE